MEEYQQITKYKYTKETFPVIKKAVNDLVDFVKPTFGPSQNKVLLNNEVKSMMIDDGVKIAEEFGSDDLMENAVIKFVQATAKKTNQRVGDGTTGCMILLQAIINGIPEIFDSLSIIKQLKTGLIEAREHLLSKSVKISTQEELKAVAEVSCNDPKIAEIIGELMYAVGLDGTIAIQDGSEMEIAKELTEGMQFERGAVSRHMFPGQKMEIVQDDAKVMLFSRKLAVKETRPILEKLVRLPETERNLILIAEGFDDELVVLLGQLRETGVCNVVAVKAPAFGNEMLEQLKDLAALLGTEVIDAQRNTGEVEMMGVGRAKKVTITENSTLILGGAGDQTKRIEELKAIKSESAFDEQKIKERISRLGGKVALIKVGGLTDEEVIADHEKIEDAVNATRVAYRGGVVDGAGLELAKIKTSSPILNKALVAPSHTLMENMGLSELKVEVKDPTEVLIAALESAVSIASLLISGKGILVTYQDKR